MRRSRDVISVIVLLLIFVVGGLLLSRPDTSESRQVGKELMPDPSVYNDRASGSKGVYDWVGALGYTPTVWRQDWGHLSQSQAPVLMIIDPGVEEAFASLTGHSTNQQSSDDILDTSDAQRLRQWLQTGHLAVLMSSRIPSGHVPGESSDDAKDTFGDAMDLVVETATGGGRSEFAPLEPVPATENVVSIHTDADVRIRRRAADGIALFGDGSGPVALDIPVGSGRLVVIADSAFASNANLARSENAVFLANLLKSGAHHGDRVLFDEYHHGDVDLANGETVWSALGRPLQLSLVQLVLALAVIIGVVSVRFGAPLPLMQGTHRSSAEYVASLASLYQRAQASPAALDVLYRQFLRDLAGRLALSPDVSLEILADTAARRGQADKQALRQLLAACENHLDTGKVTDGELLDLARRMGQIRKEMGIA